MRKSHERYEAEDDDIEVDKVNGEVNILVTSNEFGNVYVTLTFKQVLEIVKDL
jgi:hypothetical protein